MRCAPQSREQPCTSTPRYIAHWRRSFGSTSCCTLARAERGIGWRLRLYSRKDYRLAVLNIFAHRPATILGSLSGEETCRCKFADSLGGCLDGVRRLRSGVESHLLE